MATEHLKLKIFEKEKTNIPQEGPFIAVVNRFSDKYEEQVMIDLIKEVRPDVKVVSFNRSVKGDPNAAYIRDYARGWKKVRKDVIDIIREANKEDIPLVIFPGRRISKIELDRFGWDKEIVKSIFLSRIPVIPIYANWFKKLTEPLGFKIAEIYFNSAVDRELIIRIGKPILPNELGFHADTETFRKYIYAKTFSLGKSLKVERFFGNKELVQDLEIVPKVQASLVESELKKLSEEALIMKKGNLCVYLATALDISNVLTELGRLREVTFRMIGEGTGKGLDLDEFDVFYHQLIIWDESKQAIVGGCRFVYGDWVIQYYGKKGMYTNSLFQFTGKMNKILTQSVEVGRVFIAPEYQKSMSPLLMLWQSLFKILKTKPQYQYLIGSVSISNEFSHYSKKLMIYYLKKYFYNKDMGAHVHPRNPFIYRLSKTDKESLIDIQEEENIQQFNQLIEEIEPKHLKIPVLIKQYIKQHAIFLGFSIDYSFSESLDGLVLLDLKKIEPEAVKMLNRNNEKP